MSLLPLCKSGIGTCTWLFELRHYSGPHRISRFSCRTKITPHHIASSMPRLLPHSGTVTSPTPVDASSPSTAGASSHATTEADATSLARNGVENTLTRNSTTLTRNSTLAQATNNILILQSQTALEMKSSINAVIAVATILNHQHVQHQQQ